MTQRYASVVEIARLLGTTESGIRNRIARGNIPFIRDPRTGRIRFDLADIHRMMNEGRCDPEGGRGHGEGGKSV